MAAVKDNIKCPFCHRQMKMVMDTPLCPVCDRAIIYIQQGWIKKDVDKARGRK